MAAGSAPSRPRRSWSGCVLSSQHPGFTVSIRCRWNGQDAAENKDRFAAYAAAGVQHLLVEPDDREKDDWMRSVERIALTITEIRHGR